MQECQKQSAQAHEQFYEEDDGENTPSVTGEFHQGKDGKYHWVYAMEMLKNRHFFGYVVKIIMGSMLAAALLLFGMSLREGGGALLFLMKVMIPAVFLVFAITLFSYWLVAKMYGNVYCMAYDMDEEGITFSQVSDQAEIAKLFGRAVSLTGAAPHNLGMAATGMAAGSGGMTSEFYKLNKVTVDRKNHFIGLRQFLFYNMVYADDPYFDFIADYIVKRAVNAEINVR